MRHVEHAGKAVKISMTTNIMGLLEIGILL